jgi:phosphate/sulfate permease
MNSLHISIYVLGLLVFLALVFDFMNGFHDAANAIATVVSTGVLKPQTAVAMSALFNFVAIFTVGLHVATTVGKGTVDPAIVDHYVVFGALVGAIIWNVITWYYGIPSSSSHALIGGLVGAAVAKSGTGALVGGGLLKTVMWIILSPLLGFILGSLVMLAVSWIFVRTPPRKVDTWFRRLQLVSAAAYSLGHGGNDAQKTIGIIWMLLTYSTSLAWSARRERSPRASVTWPLWRPALEAVDHIGQAARAFGQVRRVDLRDVAQAQDLGAGTGARDQGLHLLRRQVLRLVDDQELVHEGAAAHEVERLDLDARTDQVLGRGAAPVAGVAVGLVQHFEVVVEGAHPRRHLFFLGARQEADVLAHRHRHAGDDDLVVELGLEHLGQAGRQRQQGLAGAGLAEQGDEIALPDSSGGSARSSARGCAR